MNDYVRLDECCQIELSSIDKKSKSSEKSVNLCNFTDVYYNWNIYSSMIDGFMEATASDKNINTFSLKKGDVVVTKDSETRDDIGMAALVYEDLPNTVLGYHCALIRPNDDIDSAYLNAYLNSYLGRKHFRNQASGSGQRYTLTKEGLGSIKIPIIPMNMQKKIGALFSNIDKKIQNNNQSIADLEAMAKLIYDYWFLQFEFPNEKGKPYKSSGGKMTWNDELKREVPEGWSVIKFGLIADFIKGKIPYTDLSSEKNEINSEPYITIDVANGAKPMYCNPEKLIPLKGETIMVMDGAASGDVYIGNHGVLGSTFSKIISKRNDVSDALIYMLLNSYSVVYKKANTGSTVPHANPDFIKQMSIVIPKDCSNISLQFTTLFKKVENCRKENQKLTSLRDFLLPMLMNGQVTFKGEA